MACRPASHVALKICAARSVARPTVVLMANRIATYHCACASDPVLFSPSRDPSSPLIRQFSSSSSRPGILGSIRNAIEERNKRSQQEKFSKQVQLMAHSEKWTLHDYSKDLQNSASGWRAQIPGIRNLQQVKQAKEALKVIQAMAEEVGGDSTFAELSNLGRTEKLKISLKSGTPVEDINVAIRQFQAVDMMHQVVRRRHLDRKPIPTDESSLKTAIQMDGTKVLSKAQKKEIQESQKKRGMRGIGRRQ